jgi:hypothetical protein
MKVVLYIFDEESCVDLLSLEEEKHFFMIFL